MNYGRKMAVCLKSRTEQMLHACTLCGKNADFLNVTASGTYIYH